MKASEQKDFQIIPAIDFPDLVRELLEEYTEMLKRADPPIAAYLDLQGYDEELLHLKKKYGLPYGRLYLAMDKDRAAGCVGLRKLSETACEMKRLYVREEYRGSHLGQRLVEKILADAAGIGYQEIYLDTQPYLQAAVRLYQKEGFEFTEKYNDSPLKDTIFMKKDLKAQNL